MRTFHLKAVEKGKEQWEITWRTEEGPITPAEMNWILTISIQAIIDRSKGPPLGAPRVPLVLSPN